MANKSFSTKGLSRQLEEKARKVQDELECLREEHAALRESFDEKVMEAKKAQDRLEELGGENEIREQRLKNVSACFWVPPEVVVLTRVLRILN
jgi:predicted nuclease with TOPRIM domain